MSSLLNLEGYLFLFEANDYCIVTFLLGVFINSAAMAALGLFWR